MDPAVRMALSDSARGVPDEILCRETRSLGTSTIFGSFYLIPQPCMHQALHQLLTKHPTTNIMQNPCTDSTKFDLCDPERHFALVVPQRARSCPPLLNAIFTASARHLSRLDKYKTAQGVKYLGKLLPDLNVETAIHYHDRAIAHLIQDR